VNGQPAPPGEPTYASIARLIFSYAERLDAGDLDGLAALFDQATFRSARPEGISVMTGAAEVRAGFAGSLRIHKGVPATQHITTNLIVDESPDGRTATARSVFTVLQSTPRLPLQVVVAGRYVDKFVRTDAGWRFVDRLVNIQHIGNISEHLLVPLEDEAGWP
jgi:3-phenylpropionate/cinnamic acid dioxygenase small subunit